MLEEERGHGWIGWKRIGWKMLGIQDRLLVPFLDGNPGWFGHGAFLRVTQSKIRPGQLLGSAHRISRLADPTAPLPLPAPAEAADALPPLLRQLRSGFGGES